MADERVVPGTTHVSNLQKHLARYNIALQYCVGVDVLDIACGTGYGTQLISRVAKSVRGVDRSEEAYKHALNHYKNKNITYEHQDFFEHDRKYDTIVCFETLEHLDDLEKAQKHLQNMLAPGGILIFSVPLNEEPGFNEHHKHIFSVADARNLFINMRFNGELLQIGVNVFQVDESFQGRSYYIGVRQLS